MKTRLAWALAISIILLPVVLWTAKQRPRLSLNAQQFGLMLTQPRYRSWFLSFCDGYTVDERGRFHAVGWHWPKFSHVDMAWLNLTNGAVPTRDAVTNITISLYIDENGVRHTNTEEILKALSESGMIERRGAITNQSSSAVPLTVNTDTVYSQDTNVIQIDSIGTNIMSVVSCSSTNFVIETPFYLVQTVYTNGGPTRYEFVKPGNILLTTPITVSNMFVIKSYWDNPDLDWHKWPKPQLSTNHFPPPFEFMVSPEESWNVLLDKATHPPTGYSLDTNGWLRIHFEHPEWIHTNLMWIENGHSPETPIGWPKQKEGKP